MFIETFINKLYFYRNMKKSELVYRELLYGVELGKASFTQLGMARSLGISISTVNNALAPLREMGALKVRRRGVDIVSARKVLYYWASVRSIGKDLIYSTCVESVVEAEKNVPPGAVFAAYSAYRLAFDDAPATPVEVIHEDPEALERRVARLPVKIAVIDLLGDDRQCRAVHYRKCQLHRCR